MGQIRVVEVRASHVGGRELDSEPGSNCRNTSQISERPVAKPRWQLALLKPELELQNWRPPKNNKEREFSCSVRTRAQKEEGGEIVSIFHINLDLTVTVRNAWVNQGLTIITAHIKPPATIQDENVQHRTKTMDVSIGKCLCLHISKWLRKKKKKASFYVSFYLFRCCSSRESTWKRL